MYVVMLLSAYPVTRTRPAANPRSGRADHDARLLDSLGERVNDAVGQVARTFGGDDSGGRVVTARCVSLRTDRDLVQLVELFAVHDFGSSRGSVTSISKAVLMTRTTSAAASMAAHLDALVTFGAHQDVVVDLGRVLGAGTSVPDDLVAAGRRARRHRTEVALEHGDERPVNHQHQAARHVQAKELSRESEGLGSVLSCSLDGLGAEASLGSLAVDGVPLGFVLLRHG